MLTDQSDWEGEGTDREIFSLPGHMDALISAVSAANPSTVVVMQSGTPIAMPWISSVNALVHAWYGGNETGNAIADILFGAVNPSAKLPLSFPKRIQDNPAFLNYRTERGRTLYGEDVYVGYRWYEMLDLPGQRLPILIFFFFCFFWMEAGNLGAVLSAGRTTQRPSGFLKQLPAPNPHSNSTISLY